MQVAADADHGVDAQQHAVAETLTEALVEEAHQLSQRLNISRVCAQGVAGADHGVDAQSTNPFSVFVKNNNMLWLRH